MISTGYDDEQLSALIQDLFNVMASGGLLFFYLQQQFTVLINYLLYTGHNS